MGPAAPGPSVPVRPPPALSRLPTELFPCCGAESGQQRPSHSCHPGSEGRRLPRRRRPAPARGDRPSRNRVSRRGLPTRSPDGRPGPGGAHGTPRPAWRRRISSRDSLTPAGGGKHFVATRWPSPPLPRRPSPALRPAAPARCPGPGLSSAPRRLAGPPEPVLAGSRVLAAAEGPSCCADPLTRASFPRILRRLLRCLLAPHVPADENLVSSLRLSLSFARCQKGRFPFLKPRTLVAEGRQRRVRGRPP